MMRKNRSANRSSNMIDECVYYLGIILPYVYTLYRMTHTRRHY